MWIANLKIYNVYKKKFRKINATNSFSKRFHEESNGEHIDENVTKYPTDIHNFTSKEKKNGVLIEILDDVLAEMNVLQTTTVLAHNAVNIVLGGNNVLIKTLKKYSNLVSGVPVSVNLAL